MPFSDRRDGSKARRLERVYITSGINGGEVLILRLDALPVANRC